MSATTTSGERAVATRRQVPKEMARILGDCRDLAIHRLLLSFTSMLDRVSDLLMARAERSDVREEQALCLDARSVLNNEGAKLIADFERHLRQHIDERMRSPRAPPMPISSATPLSTSAPTCRRSSPRWRAAKASTVLRWRALSRRFACSPGSSRRCRGQS